VHLSRVLGVAALMTVVSSCSPSTETSLRVPSSGTLTPSSLPRAATGPTLVPSLIAARLDPESLFLAYLLGPSPEEDVAIRKADDRIRSDCVARQGFDLPPPTVGPIAVPEQQQSRRVDFLYFADLDMISAWGYFWPAVPGGVPDAVAVPEVEIPTDVLEQCSRGVADAYRAEFESRDISKIVPAEIDATILVQLDADPSLDDEYRQWTTCMGRSGFPGASLRGYAGGEVPRETVEQALADAECRIESGYTQAFIDRQVQLVSEWVEENPTLVNEFRNAWASLAKRVASM
jgi:hypothetical protein